MMIFVTILFIIMVTFIQLSGGTQSCNGNATFDPSTKYDFPTRSPIDIKEEESELVSIDCPFKVHTPRHSEILTITNFGTHLDVDGVDIKHMIVGGVINPGEKFQFTRGIFYWSRNINGNAASSIDGQIAPIFIRIIWFNTKYEKFENALHHRDGLLIFEHGVIIRQNYTNNLFPTFENILKEVTSPGKSISAHSDDIWLWSIPLTEKSNVYIYPGSYVGADGVHYDCATVITWGKGFSPAISEEQFNQFIQLKNNKGELYENKLTPAPKGDRPLNHIQGNSFFIARE